MVKKTRTKAAAKAGFVPQSRDQVAEAIKEMGVLQRELARIEADMNDEMAAVKERHETDAEPKQQRVEELLQGIQVWSEANREVLTQNGKTKTAAFTTGEVQWRVRPPSVRVTGAEAVLAALRKLGLTRFIRTKEEVNKEAILNETKAVAKVPGISIQQGEDFVVTPFEVELTEAVA